jgi:hypothetical protein
MATLNGFVRLTITRGATNMQREGTVAVPQQQWLCERAALFPRIHCLSCYYMTLR